MDEGHFSSWALFSFMGLGAPLHKAVELGKADVVRYLVSEWANVHIKHLKIQKVAQLWSMLGC